MTNLKNIPIEDILASVEDTQYKQAQATELERLENTLAGLAVRYKNLKDSPFMTEEERTSIMKVIQNEIRTIHWAIGHIKEYQETVLQTK